MSPPASPLSPIRTGVGLLVAGERGICRSRRRGGNGLAAFADGSFAIILTDYILEIELSLGGKNDVSKEIGYRRSTCISTRKGSLTNSISLMSRLRQRIRSVAFTLSRTLKLVNRLSPFTPTFNGAPLRLDVTFERRRAPRDQRRSTGLRPNPARRPYQYLLHRWRVRPLVAPTPASHLFPSCPAGLPRPLAPISAAPHR